MKICSLLPSGTEILFALGLSDSVTGVSDLCLYPPEAAAKRIVSRSKIDVETMSSEEVEERMRQILSAGESPYELDLDWLWDNPPDVVLTQDLCYFCEVDAATVDRAVMGMPVQPRVVVLQPRTLAEIFASICEIGNVCEAAEAAQRLVDGLSERVESVTDRLDSAASRPKAYSLEGINPIVVGGHWIPELLGLAGGEAPYAPGCAACRVSWDEVREYSPEKLFIDLCSSDIGRSLREVSWLAGQEGWAQLPAVRTGEVYLIDHVYFSCPGPRVVQGLEILAQLTHPGLFDGMVPEGAVVKLDPALEASAETSDISRCFRPYPGAAL